MQREQRRRGRPKNTTTVHSDRLQHVWVAVEVARRRKGGSLLSVSKACHLVALEGGLVSLVGGNVDAIRASLHRENQLGPKQNLPRFMRLARRGREVRLLNDPQGPLIVAHLTNHVDTIRARYYEANLIVENELGVRDWWMKVVTERLHSLRSSAGT